MKYNFSEFPFLTKLFLLGSLLAASVLSQPFRESESQERRSQVSGKRLRNDTTSTVPAPALQPRFEGEPDFAEKASWKDKQ